MNNINIVGRLVDDVVSAKTTNGTTVVKNAIAYNDRRNGEKIAMYFKFVAYGRTAELIERYFKKGDEIGLTGKLIQESFDGRDGKRHSLIQIQVNEITFTSGRKYSDNGSVSVPSDNDGMVPVFDTDDGDLPF